MRRKVVIERVEQVVRLIRSKGVGVYFVTQNPLDVPETVLAQLGNRVQHALRAYSPRERRQYRRPRKPSDPTPPSIVPKSSPRSEPARRWSPCSKSKGAPSIVERTLIRPPSGRIGPVTDTERQAVINASPVAGLYDETVDRRSAFEILTARARKAAEQDAAKQDSGSAGGRWTLPGFGGDDDKPASRGRSGYQRENDHGSGHEKRRTHLSRHKSAERW